MFRVSRFFLRFLFGADDADDAAASSSSESCNELGSRTLCVGRAPARICVPNGSAHSPQKDPDGPTAVQ